MVGPDIRHSAPPSSATAQGRRDTVGGRRQRSDKIAGSHRPTQTPPSRWRYCPVLEVLADCSGCTLPDQVTNIVAKTRFSVSEDVAPIRIQPRLGDM